MLAVLLKAEAIQILRHGNPVDTKDYSFKNDFVKENGTDTMVLRIQEKVSEETLNKVRVIMHDTFNQTYAMKESEIKNGVIEFFTRKKTFLESLKVKYGSKRFPGDKLVPAIYADVQAIVRSNDSATIFNEIISRENSLEDNSDYLEQLETFYKEGSAQQEAFGKAREIVAWFDENRFFGDLSKMSDTVDAIAAILRMDVPFGKMSELNGLIFAADGIKQQILQDKFDKAIKSINSDKEKIRNELDAVLSGEASDAKKQRIQDKYDAIMHTYDSWDGMLSSKTNNLDSYVVSSTSTLNSFKSFINKTLLEAEAKPVSPDAPIPPTPVRAIRSKDVRVIDCVPVAKKKIKSHDDIDSVIDYIRKELEKALKDNDELNLD